MSSGSCSLPYPKLPAMINRSLFSPPPSLRENNVGGYASALRSVKDPPHKEVPTKSVGSEKEIFRKWFRQGTGTITLFYASAETLFRINCFDYVSMDLDSLEMKCGRSSECKRRVRLKPKKMPKPEMSCLYGPRAGTCGWNEAYGTFKGLGNIGFRIAFISYDL